MRPLEAMHDQITAKK